MTNNRTLFHDFVYRSLPSVIWLGPVLLAWLSLKSYYALFRIGIRLIFRIFSLIAKIISSPTPIVQLNSNQLISAVNKTVFHSYWLSSSFMEIFSYSSDFFFFLHVFMSFLVFVKAHIYTLPLHSYLKLERIHWIGAHKIWRFSFLIGL